MSRPSSPVDEVNPFSSDPSPFSDSSSTPIPASSPSTSQPSTTSQAYPFSADPYAQHTPTDGGEGEARREEEEDQEVTINSPPLPQTPSGTGQGQVSHERESYQKTSREVIQVRFHVSFG